MKKMKLNVINPSHKITMTYTNQQYIIAKLLGLLFNKTIADNRHIRRIKYNYNYSNTQNITFIFDNDYQQEFTNIPTMGGLLNDFEIEQLMKKESEVK